MLGTVAHGLAAGQVWGTKGFKIEDGRFRFHALTAREPFQRFVEQLAL